jgi:death-on-curing protein
MIYFLNLDDVLTLHDLLLTEFSGSAGVRSHELLASALAQPQASFGGCYLHDDIVVMAAAYAYHIIKNHPFVDGNKRTGIFTAITFLERNDRNVDFAKGELYALAVAVATSKLSKEKLAKILRNAVFVKKRAPSKP